MEAVAAARRTRETLVMVGVSVWLGIFSMGFQLLGSRMLNPWFGSSIVVWAFLISTFLAAFSAGSFVGGLVARQEAGRRARGLWWVIGVTLVGFGLNAVGGQSFLAWLDDRMLSVELGLILSCAALFLLPVCGLAALTPLMVERLALAGHEAGFASGLIYSVGTIGNIVGIMLTAFVLIPLAPISVMLWVWTGGVAVGTLVLGAWMRR